MTGEHYQGIARRGIDDRTQPLHRSAEEALHDPSFMAGVAAGAAGAFLIVERMHHQQRSPTYQAPQHPAAMPRSPVSPGFPVHSGHQNPAMAGAMHPAAMPTSLVSPGFPGFPVHSGHQNPAMAGAMHPAAMPASQQSAQEMLAQMRLSLESRRVQSHSPAAPAVSSPQQPAPQHPAAVPTSPVSPGFPVHSGHQSPAMAGAMHPAAMAGAMHHGAAMPAPQQSAQEMLAQMRSFLESRKGLSPAVPAASAPQHPAAMPRSPVSPASPAPKIIMEQMPALYKAFKELHGHLPETPEEIAFVAEQLKIRPWDLDRSITPATVINEAALQELRDKSKLHARVRDLGNM